MASPKWARAGVTIAVTAWSRIVRQRGTRSASESSTQRLRRLDVAGFVDRVGEAGSAAAGGGGEETAAQPAPDVESEPVLREGRSASRIHEAQAGVEQCGDPNRIQLVPTHDHQEHEADAHDEQGFLQPDAEEARLAF